MLRDFTLCKQRRSSRARELRRSGRSDQRGSGVWFPNRRGGRSAKTRPAESTRTAATAAVAAVAGSSLSTVLYARLTLERSRRCLGNDTRACLEVENAEAARVQNVVSKCQCLTWNDRIQERTSPLSHAGLYLSKDLVNDFFLNTFLILILICVWCWHCLSREIFRVGIVYVLHVLTPNPLHSPLTTHWTR